MKHPKNQGFWNNTEKISQCCVSKGFKEEPDRIGESTSGTIIWAVCNPAKLSTTFGSFNQPLKEIMVSIQEKGLIQISLGLYYVYILFSALPEITCIGEAYFLKEIGGYLNAKKTNL